MTHLPLDLSGADAARLQRAAGLLSGIGHADPEHVDDGLGLLCLAAAETLRRLGVDPGWVPVDPHRLVEVLDEALACLAGLSEPVFATTAVLDAAADARAARALQSRRG